MISPITTATTADWATHRRPSLTAAPTRRGSSSNKHRWRRFNDDSGPAGGRAHSAANPAATLHRFDFMVESIEIRRFGSAIACRSQQETSGSRGERTVESMARCMACRRRLCIAADRQLVSHKNRACKPLAPAGDAFGRHGTHPIAQHGNVAGLTRQDHRTPDNAVDV